MTDRRAQSEDGGEVAGGIEIAPGVRVPEDSLQVRFARSGGPGGQNVNKLSTRAELRISLEALSTAVNDPATMLRLRALAGGRITRDGILQLMSQEFRTQEGNRAEVFQKLADLIVEARKAPRPRRATRPSRASKRKRIEEKRRRSQVKARRQGREEA